MGLGRAPCCDKVGLNRGAWTPEEDARLAAYIRRYGHDNWRALPKKAGLLRCGKSCRLRWINYLRPDIRRGNFSKEEEDTVIKLHGLLGNKWSKIASCLPGRTDNEIKNVWNTHLKKRPKLEELSSSASPAMENDGATVPKDGPSSPSSGTNSFSGESKCSGHLSRERRMDDEVLSLDELHVANLDVWDMHDDPALPLPRRPLPSEETTDFSDSIGDSIDEILGIDVDPELWNDITTSTQVVLAEEKQRWLVYLEEELGLFDDGGDKMV